MLGRVQFDLLVILVVDLRLQQLVNDVEDAQDALKSIVFGEDVRDVEYKSELECAPVLSDEEDLDIDKDILDGDTIVHKCNNCLQFFDISFFDIHCGLCHKCFCQMLDE